MAVFPTHSFDEQNIKFRFGERYISEASNQKFLGIPRGVYLGFVPSTSGTIVSFDPDSNYNVSLARLTSQDDSTYSIDVATDGSPTLDFSEHTTYPINVILKANGALGFPHSATLETQVAPASDPTELLICVVAAALNHDVVANGPFQVGETVTGGTSGATASVISVGASQLLVGSIAGGPFVIGDTLTGGTSLATTTMIADQAVGALSDPPTNRSTPFAWSTAPLGYGFMRDGAVEELINAVALTAEIQAARVDLLGVTHPTLGGPPSAGPPSNRLEEDLKAEAMGGRLGKEIRNIVGIDTTLVGAANTINVSRSFSAVHRSVAGLTPIENISGFGTELFNGAITDGTVPGSFPVEALPDAERNVCAVIEIDTTLYHGVVTSGPFQVGETITGGTSGATGVVSVVGSDTIKVSSVAGEFDLPETITGGTSSASAEANQATTNARLTSGTGEVAYGRLDFDEIELSGTLTFNGTTTVTGSGTTFNDGSILAGDIIEAPNGDYYEVASTPVSPVSLTITSVPGITSGSSSGLHRRRFELNIRVRNSPTADTAFSLSGGLTIRFFFPVWRQLDEPQFDYLPLLAGGFEDVAVPLATTTQTGLATITPDAGDGQAGAVFQVVLNTTNVIGTNVIGINFDGAADGGPGIADITQTGPTGPTGPDGAGGLPGPTGPQGPQGRGITKQRFFAESPQFDHGLLGFGVIYTFEYNFRTLAPNLTELLMLSGGVSEWNCYETSVFDSNDHFFLLDIERLQSLGPSAPFDTGRIEAQVPPFGSAIGFNPLARIKWFLNGAGD